MKEPPPIRLYDAGGDVSKTWYFEIYHDDPLTGKRKRTRKTYNINRYRTSADRYAFAKMFINDVNELLRKGVEIKDKKPDPAFIEVFEAYSLKYGARKSDRTRESYRLHIGRLRDFLKANALESILLSNFTEEIAQGFIDYLAHDRQLSASSVNSTLQLYKQFGEHLCKKNNPFAGIKRIPMQRSLKYKPFTHEEKEAIAKKLQSECPLLYLFAQIVYFCFIRPKEICALRGYHFNFSENPSITVESSFHKSAKTSQRQVFPPLLKIMKAQGIDKLPPNALVFQGICGNNPSLKLRRKKVDELWNKLIIKGLGIDNHLYALKHTGNIDYILSNPNYDILWLQRQNGHSSLEMTQKYIRDLGVYRIDPKKVKFHAFGDVF